MGSKNQSERIRICDLSVPNAVRLQAGRRLVLAGSSPQNEERKDVYNRGMT